MMALLMYNPTLEGKERDIVRERARGEGWYMYIHTHTQTYTGTHTHTHTITAIPDARTRLVPWFLVGFYVLTTGITATTAVSFIMYTSESLVRSGHSSKILVLSLHVRRHGG